jgi:4-amino-4-deoxy-L-arabinose transferase-like glycosyltransferase
LPGSDASSKVQFQPGIEIMSAKTRWLSILLLTLAAILCLTRFFFLRADFPNHSPWIMDEAKYTDEGWWANAAVRHFLNGHWELAGDYNPAVAVPVWPLLLTCIFQITGVSLVAARATNVAFSIATVALAYMLLRRYGGRQETAALAALLLAASPFAFAFSRLATLDTLIIFEWTLCLWVASYAESGRRWPIVALSLLLPVMLLTKTTALVLLPAVFWLLLRKSWRSALSVAAIAAAVIGLWLWAVARSRYAGDYNYFFDINALADVDWRSTGSYIVQLLRNGMWIDKILYPAGLAALLLSLRWLRPLWRNPLFVAAWIGFAGEAVYILRRQDDYAPRYFLAMLLPLILILALTLDEARTRNRGLGLFVAATLTVALVLDTAQTAGFLHRRRYQFYEAAESIREIVNRDPNAHRLLLGSSGDQLSLMVQVPAINDGYSSQDLGQKVTLDQPGWYVGWNDLDQDIMGFLSAFRLRQVASFPVFDRDQRNRLILYRMERVK